MDINITLLNTAGTILAVFALVVIWAINTPDEENKSSERKILDNNKS